jgi:hypothetical protein
MHEDPTTPGEDAKNLLRRIVGETQRTENPPGVILMSRSRPGEPVDWISVAEESGYLRFNFRFVDKQDLTRSADSFRYFLLDLVRGVPLGRAYYRHVVQIRAALNSVAERVSKKVMGLSPGDFGLFAGQVLQDPTGYKAVNHLMYLFSNLIDATLRNDPGVVESLEAFRGTLSSHPPTALASESDSLHKIHSELLYDRSSAVLNAPIGFGDIYWRPKLDRSTLYLVITPECDLEPRKDGGPKVSSIVLLTGRIETSNPNRGDDRVVTPLLIDEDRCCWVVWRLQEPVVIDAGLLVRRPEKEFRPGAPIVSEPAESGAAETELTATIPESVDAGDSWHHTVVVTATFDDSLPSVVVAVAQPADESQSIDTQTDAASGEAPRWVVAAPHLEERVAYIKWGRLHRDHAEGIQQRYATDLLEVGTEDLLEATNVREMIVLAGPNETSAAARVSLIEYRMGKEVFHALGEDGSVLLEALPYVISSDMLLEMRRLTPKTAFKKFCEKSHLWHSEIQGSNYLVYAKGGLPKNWEPKIGR